MRIKHKYLRNLLIFTFFFSIFLLFSNGRYGGDGLENYLTAESLVLDRDIFIYDRPFDVSEMNYTVKGEEGGGERYISDIGIGMPVLLTPFYSLGHAVSKVLSGVPHDYVTQFCVSVSNPFFSALTACLIFSFVVRLGYSGRTALISSICYGLCTMCLIYTRSGFSEPVIGLIVLAVIYLIYVHEETGSVKYLFLAGLLTGYSVLVKKNSFLYLPLISVYLVYRCFRVRDLKTTVKICAAIGIPLFTMVLAFFAISGKFGPSGAAGELNSVAKVGFEKGSGLLKGLFYYLLSPGKGFLWFNIPLFLGLYGIKGIYEKEKQLTLYMIAFMVVTVLFYSFHFRRGSLFSWGPRYLYPCVPLLAIFLAEVIENSKTIIKKWVVGLFLFAGSIVQLPGLFLNISAYFNLVKEKLMLQEYLINFVPELSPITGMRRLFISAVSRTLYGRSLDLTFSPDHIFVDPVTVSIAGYDSWDVWWVHALKISESTLPLVVIALIFLALTAMISFYVLWKLLSENLKEA